MKIIETEKFLNAGYGWVCKKCTKRQEIEQIEKAQKPFSPAFAKWQDASHRNLYCRHCGATEEIDKA